MDRKITADAALAALKKHMTAFDHARTRIEHTDEKVLSLHDAFHIMADKEQELRRGLGMEANHVIEASDSMSATAIINKEIRRIRQIPTWRPNYEVDNLFAETLANLANELGITIEEKQTEIQPEQPRWDR